MKASTGALLPRFVSTTSLTFSLSRQVSHSGRSRKRHVVEYKAPGLNVVRECLLLLMSTKRDDWTHTSVYLLHICVEPVMKEGCKRPVFEANQ
jgi:hypothetical protein